MRLSPIAIALTVALIGCGGSGPETAEVSDAWVRLAAVPGRPSAAYFTISGGRTADRLVEVTSPRVARIELHESMAQGGVMTMRPLPAVPVPAGGKLMFAPGGNHAMLFGLDEGVAPGTPLPLAFRFASGKRVETLAKTVAAGADAPAGHEGH